jgi:hypothetical protein
LLPLLFLAQQLAHFESGQALACEATKKQKVQKHRGDWIEGKDLALVALVR